MKELLQAINAGAEKLYYITHYKPTMSIEELNILECELNSMQVVVAMAKKEAKHLYEKKEG